MLRWLTVRAEGALRFKDLLYLLVQRDVKLKYRRSFLGYLWSVLNPLFVMMVMIIVFSNFFKQDIENFPVYLFTGQLIFNYTTTASSNALESVIANGALIKKVYIPKYIFVLARVLSSLVDTVFSMGALLLVMLVTRAPFSPVNLLFPFVILQQFFFTLGLGLFLAQITVFFRDVKYIYNAVVTAWMYFTPIMYPIDILPDWVKWLEIHCNPLYSYVAQFRALMYYGRLPEPSLVLWGTVMAFIMLVFGLVTFFRAQDRFILYI